jgi:hypothetical protein
MKCWLLPLIVIICTLSGIRVSAQSTNVIPWEVRSDRATFLTTKPATINSNWGIINRKNHLQTPGLSISVIRQRECQNIIELIKDPARILKECEKEKNNPTFEDTQSIDYFKPPKQLDSSINITVTKF